LIYRFENFSLDCDRRELRRGSEILAVEPQVFDVLEFLIANRNRVVSKSRQSGKAASFPTAQFRPGSTPFATQSTIVVSCNV